MTQVSKKMNKQSKTGPSDMSQVSKKMRKQVDNSWSWMEERENKKFKARGHARKNDSRSSMGNKTVVNKAWNTEWSPGIGRNPSPAT